MGIVKPSVRVQDIHALRVAMGVCRHCGSEVPCWSEFGDRAVGKKHTKASFAKRRKAAK